MTTPRLRADERLYFPWGKPLRQAVCRTISDVPPKRKPTVCLTGRNVDGIDGEGSPLARLKLLELPSHTLGISPLADSQAARRLLSGRCLHGLVTETVRSLFP